MSRQRGRRLALSYYDQLHYLPSPVFVPLLSVSSLRADIRVEENRVAELAISKELQQALSPAEPPVHGYRNKVITVRRCTSRKVSWEDAVDVRAAGRGYDEGV
jgi:hypothetical protein